MQSDVPAIRISDGNARGTRPDGQFVLYWMIANRRSGWNYSLQRAVDYARAWGKPLVVLEALRCDYRWASDRLHRFVLQGMAANRRAFAEKSCFYYPYVEPHRGADHGLLAALAERACVIVTDDFPTFFLPRMIRRIGSSLPVRLELIDSNGVLPMRAADRIYPTAYAFRRFLQKTLPEHLTSWPAADPLADAKLPPVGEALDDILARWPAASDATLKATPEVLAALPIDHTVGAGSVNGGSQMAAQVLRRFLSERLSGYAEQRNEPEAEGSSGFSPYLHFGHLSAHEVFAGLVDREKWEPGRLSSKTSGKREGWWGMSAAAESFLDELITWRELGYNMCWQQENYNQYESLPEWAKQTLADHETDPRKHLYSLAEFEAAATHDPLWNAAQRQLVTEGRMHNYLRMLWGKKILEWTPSPRQALRVLIELNNKYALDGRNPNSYSGIFWVLGRYDRAWGPERAIFGKIRYMSSDNTARKHKVGGYLERYAPPAGRLFA